MEHFVKLDLLGKWGIGCCGYVIS